MKTLMFVSLAMMLIFLSKKAYSADEYCATIESVSTQECHDPNFAITSDITIPVIFHVIYASDGTGNVGGVQLADQINWINTTFNNTHFSFRLAAVTRTQNDVWFNLSRGSQEETDMRNALAIDPQHVLNIYIIDMGIALFGWAKFPWQGPETSKLHGIVINYGSLRGGYLTNYNQ